MKGEQLGVELFLNKKQKVKKGFNSPETLPLSILLCFTYLLIPKGENVEKCTCLGLQCMRNKVCNVNLAHKVKNKISFPSHYCRR